MFLLLFQPYLTFKQTDYFKGEYPILFQGEQKGNAKIIDTTVYVPVNFLKDYVDETIWFDEHSSAMIITTANHVLQLPIESTTIYVDGREVNGEFPTIRSQKDSLYIALESISDYYALTYDVLPETNAVFLQVSGDQVQEAEVIKKGDKAVVYKLRTKSNPRTPYTGTVVQGEPLHIEKEQGDYYFVRKQSGIGGYLKKKHVLKGKQHTITVESSFTENRPQQIPDTPIHLAWEAVYTKNPHPAELSSMEGVHVVSPTWFSLENQHGKVKDLGSKEYIQWAKAKGLHIWGLFSNNFDPELTREAFAKFETRQNIIQQLLQLSKKYGLNGLNIDIENVDVADGPLITQFVREATPYFHSSGLVVSMDITFIAKGNWSAFYEREKLADVVDYLIVMAYDEHWATSPQAGSVASLPWVENNLQQLLHIVPNDRLILGIPLYTRLWKEEADGNGGTELSSKALSMKAAQEWWKERKLTPTFDAQTRQNYVKYQDPTDDSFYQMWLEDEVSLAERLHLVETYNLAGVACWARYFANESAWKTLAGFEKKVATKKRE